MNKLTEAAIALLLEELGIDGTMLPLPGSMESSYTNPYTRKFTLTYSVTWQTDRCTSRRMFFHAPCLTNYVLAQVFSKKMPEQATTKKKKKKKQLRYVYRRLSMNYVRGHMGSSHHPLAPLCWRALNLYFHFQVIELSEQTVKSCGSDCTIRS